MDMECIIGVTEANSWDNGLITKYKVLEYTHGLMDENTKVNL